MTTRYAVIGHPVAHSLSPRIHAAFGRQHGTSVDYRAIDPGLDGLEAALGAFAGEFDLVVNATSASREGAFLALPRSLVGRRTAAVDLSYGDAAIGFLAWARAAGAHDVIDGLGMLVEQAAESFHLWHGVRPDTDAVYAELREHDRSLVNAD